MVGVFLIGNSDRLGGASLLIIDGYRIDYHESGDGPPVLFVPGSFSAPAAWLGLQKWLPQRYHFVATSLCGYGATEETRSLGDCGIEHETRVIEAVAKTIGAPVHLVGHSFGGVVALATALGGAVEVLSIATFEANPLSLIRERGHMEIFETMQRMSAAFETAYHAGERDAAGRIIDFWGGAHSFAAMPETVREICRATAFANVLDWHTAYSFEATMADYARLTIPALVVRGARANPAMVKITEALEASLPNVHPAVIDGASHFLITTHAKDCGELLAGFLAEVAG